MGALHVLRLSRRRIRKVDAAEHPALRHGAVRLGQGQVMADGRTEGIRPMPLVKRPSAVREQLRFHHSRTKVINPKVSRF